MKQRWKKIWFGLSFSMISIFSVFAADDDGWTEAEKGPLWDAWVTQWEQLKDDWTQISLAPGKDETQLNLAWYAPVNVKGNPIVKISESKSMKEAKEFIGQVMPAVDGYVSNKVTITDLLPNRTYYYSYGQDGGWSEPQAFKTQYSDVFSFIVTADPQIGSSSECIAIGEKMAQGQEKAARNDAFNWNDTINQALSMRKEASFILNVGDQVQTREKKGEQFTYTKNEVEYVGFLSPKALKSLPIATVIGNHDSPSGNYSFHFNNPNTSSYGQTMAGSDYYYAYGDVLFIVLNSNSDDFKAHEALIQEAIQSHPTAKWRLVAMHHDIYGSGEHSNDPFITAMRYELVPLFEKYEVDVVLTGHDHTYSRSKFLKGAVKDDATFISGTEFLAYIRGEKEADERYQAYLEAVQDEQAIIATDEIKNGVVSNPEGILYYALNSSSGSKYYQFVESKQAYVASRWQENVPTFMIVDVTPDKLTLSTYRTDTLTLIDETVTIEKSFDH